MAEQLTQMILRRIEQAKNVRAGIDTVIDDAVAAYGEYLAPVVSDGETPVDVRQHLVLLRRKTDSHIETLQGIDMGVLNRTSDRDVLRVELGALVGDVVVKVRRVTDVVSGVYGKENLPVIGLDGPMTRVPLRLYERGRRSQSLLRGPDLKLRPKAGFALGADGENNVFSPLALADEMEPELTDLGLLVDARFEDDREQTLARLRRNRTMREFDLGMRGVIRIVQGMLLAVGREELATRFRSSLRRSAPQQGSSPPDEGRQDPSPAEASQGGESQGEGPIPSPPADASTPTP